MDQDHPDTFEKRQKFTQLWQAGVGARMVGTASAQSIALWQDYLVKEVLYPVAVVEKMYHFTRNLADILVKDFPTIKSKQDFYKAPDKEKSAYLTRINQQVYPSSHHKDPVPSPPVDVEKNRSLEGFYEPVSNRIVLSSALIQNFEQLIGTNLHEAGHALIAQSVRCHFVLQDDSAWANGLAFSKQNAKFGEADYDHSPEEAIVRHMAAFGTELVSPNTKSAYQEVFMELYGAYADIAAGKQFDDHAGHDTALQTTSKYLNGLRSRPGNSLS